MSLRSGDYGVVRLALLNTTLTHIGSGKSISHISVIEGRSIKTINNRISLAEHLNLISKFGSDVYLTEFGNAFISTIQETNSDSLNEFQTSLLGRFVTESPFFSAVTYTILALVETVFFLSKSNYPVPVEMIRIHFVTAVGKDSTWQTKRAKQTATYIYTNYSCELQFTVKINNHVYLTPKGIDALLLLHMNRSIKLIGSRQQD